MTKDYDRFLKEVHAHRGRASLVFSAKHDPMLLAAMRGEGFDVQTVKTGQYRATAHAHADKDSLGWQFAQWRKAVKMEDYCLANIKAAFHRAGGDYGTMVVEVHEEDLLLPSVVIEARHYFATEGYDTLEIGDTSITLVMTQEKKLEVITDILRDAGFMT
jgi:hypothetical protein